MYSPGSLESTTYPGRFWPEARSNGGTPLEPPANRLAGAASAYLRQHAGNPVDWYPWGGEALARARALDRPIFLSIGYSACHWCHVMAHESFEDPETARLLNQDFVSIKVDREERPDLDEVYMQAVQLFSGGHGGWPMSVFLTPDLEPYFGGTYFPPEDRHGLPGFRTVLRFVAEAYRSRRRDVAQTTQQVVEALRRLERDEPAADTPGRAVLDAAQRAFRNSFDAVDGGFGGAPKFPHAMGLSFLMRHHLRDGAPETLHMVEHTLQRMARGGIYDQLGGGFHRYATDAHWLVPHFEKMLYDNALLARTYLEAFQLTARHAYRDTGTDVLDYVLREMTLPEGGFCASQDADSDGGEGRFFVWTPEEIASALGSERARIVCRYYDVTERGNFEHGASVLAVRRHPEVVAAELGMSPDDLAATIAACRPELLQHRARRPAPGRDDKVVVAWSSLMTSAFAQAFTVLRRTEHLHAATRAAEFVLERAPERLFRTAAAGGVHGTGFLDDHACFVAALLDLYEATFEARWIEAALHWTDVVERDFADPGAGGYFYTGRHQETILRRSRQAFDNATPSGSSVHCSNLLRLADFTGEAPFARRAEGILRLFAADLERHPAGLSEMLAAADRFLGPCVQVAVAGSGGAARRLLEVVQAHFRPRTVVAGWPESGRPAPLALLAGRPTVNGQAAAYVCRGSDCALPVTEPERLEALLREDPRGASHPQHD